MSDVKRYSFWPQIVHLPGGGGVRAEVHFKVEEDGLFVAHQDYASLKAEVEFFKKQYSEAVASIRPTRIENESIKAENERLRKAGDAIDEAFKKDGYTLHGVVKALRDWNAAKEGKPSV